MALVNHTIPGLFGGVSQQDASLRHETQVTEMINCYPTVIGGVTKRPPSKLAYVDNTFPTDAFTYAYDRGAGNEQYIITIKNEPTPSSPFTNIGAVNTYPRYEPPTLTEARGLTSVDTGWTYNENTSTWLGNIETSSSISSAFFEFTVPINLTLPYSLEAGPLTDSLYIWVNDVMTVSTGSGSGSLALSSGDVVSILYTSSSTKDNPPNRASFTLNQGIFGGDIGYYRIFDVITNQWVNNWTSHAYLTIPTGSSTKNSFTMSTVGDTTFVVNKTKVCRMSATIDDNGDPDWDSTFYYWVSRTNGDDDANKALRYTYYVDGYTFETGTATTTNSNGNLTDNTQTWATDEWIGSELHNVTQGWSAKIVDNTGTMLYTDSGNTVATGDVYSIEKVGIIHHDSNEAARKLGELINKYTSLVDKAEGSVLRITNGTSLKGSDSWGNQASKSFLGKAKKLQDLPNDFGFEGAVLEVTGDEETGFDNFYVKYENGVWKETFKPNQYCDIDNTTMPCRIGIRRDTDGSYLDLDATTNGNYISTIEWSSRQVGDENSASEPSFIGKNIEDLFFYRNRLGVLAGDNVILSESGEYYNFFPTTVTSVIDSDPIDVAVDSNQAVTLRYAVPFNKELLLFGDKSQFVMSSGDILSPKDVSVQQSTAFDIKRVKPITLGPNAYFASEKNNYSSIREYFVQPDSLNNDAADVTAHCPNYIPKNITHLAGSSANDMLFVVSSDTPDTIYVYNFYWNGEEKAQSAWHKWTFNGTIFGIDAIGSNLLLMIDRYGQVALEMIPLEYTLNISDISYQDTGTVDYTSSIILSKPGFPTGNDKVDDNRGTLLLRNLKFNVDYGSLYNVLSHRVNRPRDYYYNNGVGHYPSKSYLNTKEYSMQTLLGTVPTSTLYPSTSLYPGSTTYAMSSDNKYSILGNVNNLEIEITNDIPSGFRLNSLDIVGTYVKNSRNV